MSEKTLWKWLSRKMQGTGWSGRRFEGCNSKGIPDTFQVFMYVHTWVELKDWSTGRKHPLSVDQKNFLETYNGSVMIKTGKNVFYMIHDSYDLTPLLSCDVEYVKRAGVKWCMGDFDPQKFFREGISE